MNILYGIRSSGNGHLSASSIMIHALKQQGAKVDAIFSGQIRPQTDSFVQKLQPIAQHPGIIVANKKDKPNVVNTLKQIEWRRFIQDISHIDLTPYDLIISDYDHFTAWAGKKHKHFVIGLSRQASLHYKTPLPKGFGLTKLFMKYSAPCSLAIGQHWHHFNQPILPPIIRPEFLNLTSLPSSEKNILVYLPRMSIAQIQQQFKAEQTYTFHIFHPEISETMCQQDLYFHPIDQQKFSEHLLHCSGVICSSGFNLISECLLLGKKILTVPVEHFLEQKANQLVLKNLNLAYTTDALNPDSINHWLAKPSLVKADFPDVATSLSQWLIQGEWHTLNQLSHKLWQQTHYKKLAE